MKGIDELDHYELLEIPRNATTGEVERAYRIAKQTYGKGSLALYGVFEEREASAIRDRLDEAWVVLSDPELRAGYDEQLPPIVAAPVGRVQPLTVDESAIVAGAAGGAIARGPLGRAEDAIVDAFDEAVEEYDALEDDGKGEFDGVRLRRTRMFRGYELDDISEITKVSGMHLRNIEEENFRDLPADVYVRGFVTAYAKTIGLDPAIVVPSYMARVQDSRSEGPRGRFLARR
ncbi:MAG: helix-turn-helix domain-containing protein [Myxococcales bacterium]|nr:helix-turn-helix domain-containing protein [Myxococcales bacterium]